MKNKNSFAKRMGLKETGTSENVVKVVLNNN